MKTETRTRVLNLMTKVFSVPTAEEAALLSRLDGSVWDSLRHTELLFAVEDAFQVRFSAEDFAAIRTTDELVSRVEELRSVVAAVP